MKIAVVGAGPAGLYFARLALVGLPGAQVSVFEQNPAEITWGFGVGLGSRSMREISDHDEGLYRAILAEMVFDSRQTISLDGEAYTVEYAASGGAIERLTLLKLLASACRDCRVELTYEKRVTDARALQAFDLVVAADGVNSILRRGREDAFKTRRSELTNRFAWFGVERALKPNALVFRRWKGGCFVAHVYSYAAESSTFVAECDQWTWTGLGLDQLDEAGRRRMIEEVFSAELEGAPLVDNCSIWRRFPVVSSECWYDGTTVLIGDALRSAHFSIGSGTRLAMEDASELFGALRDCEGEISRALPRFVERRTPARSAFSEAARRSFLWYEDVAARMRQPLPDFIHDFLTRTGRISEERLQTYAPGFYDYWRREGRLERA